MSRFAGKPSALPLTLAVQGLAFVLIAFFTSGSMDTGARPAGSAGSHAAPGALAEAQLEIPRDLAPERLPVPRLPDVANDDEPPVPKPEDTGSKAPVVRGPLLSNLRTANVALASLAPVNFAAPLPGAPDSLVGQSLSGRSGASWLAGSRTARNGSGSYAGPSDRGDGNGGRGGSGIGGSGSGSGGYCPSPLGIGGGRGRGPGPGAVGGAGGVGGGRGRPVGTTGAGAGGGGSSAGSGDGSRGGGGPAGKPGRPTKTGKSGSRQ